MSVHEYLHSYRAVIFSIIFSNIRKLSCVVYADKTSNFYSIMGQIQTFKNLQQDFCPFVISFIRFLMTFNATFLVDALCWYYISSFYDTSFYNTFVCRNVGYSVIPHRKRLYGTNWDSFCQTKASGLNNLFGFLRIFLIFFHVEEILSATFEIYVATKKSANIFIRFRA